MNFALLIINVQYALFNGKTQSFEAQRVIERINELTMLARSLAIPFFSFRMKKRLSASVSKCRLAMQSLLNTEAHDYFIRKTTPDSFLQISLEQTLTELQVKHVVVCGYDSSSGSSARI
jgi:nicotinamidase-related amidase